jgi:ABC-type transport system involved in multi-copper enzyme maturation permease subunit
MIKLLKIELKKIRTYKIFWILAGLYFIFLVLGILMAEFMINNMVDNMNKHLPIPAPHMNIYFFPEVWQNMAFFATIRYVLIFPAIIIMILITNEFTFKTIRQNVVNGLSKSEFILSKLYIILSISVITTVFFALSTFIIGIAHTSEVTWGMIFDKISFVIGFFITILTFQIYAFFFGFMCRNTGLAIALFTLYTFIIEPILYYFLKSPLVFKNGISTYLPVNAVFRVTEYPTIPVLKKMMGLNLQESISWGGCALPLLYSAIMIGIVFWTLKKRDL